MSSSSCTVIVLGGSVAGLLAAGAAFGENRRVIVIDRDVEPNDDGDIVFGRKGTPQDEHIHGILDGGIRCFEQLCPGFSKIYQENGARVVDRAKDIRYFRGNQWMTSYEGSYSMFSSRPIVDRTLRKSLKAKFGSNLEFRWSTSVSGLKFSSDSDTVEGVILSTGEIVYGDLVVDALGRGSRCDKYLEENGFGLAPMDEIYMDLAYSSNIYSFDIGTFEHLTTEGLIIFPSADTSRGCTTVRINPVVVPGVSDEKHNKAFFLVTLYGYQEHKPNCKSHSEFLSFSKALLSDSVFTLLQLGTPVNPQPKVYATPKQFFRRYDKLSAFPKRFVALGDSVCALDPSYGQGMSTAAYEAVVLQEAMESILISGTTQNAQMEISNRAYMPFMINAMENFKYKRTTGYNPPMSNVVRWALERAFQASAKDKVVFNALLDVANYNVGPEIFVRPSIMFRILVGGFD